MIGFTCDLEDGTTIVGRRGYRDGGAEDVVLLDLTGSVETVEPVSGGRETCPGAVLHIRFTTDEFREFARACGFWAIPQSELR